MPAALWLWGAKRRLKQTALTSPLAAASSARAAVSAAGTPGGLFAQRVRAGGQRGQAGRLGGRDAEGLLADDVPAGPQGGRGLLRVDVVGAGHVDGGQRGVLDQGLDRGVGGGPA